MPEYLEREAVLQIINAVNETGGFASYDDYSALFDEIDTMPTADVQPKINVQGLNNLLQKDSNGKTIISDYNAGVLAAKEWLLELIIKNDNP